MKAKGLELTCAAAGTRQKLSDGTTLNYVAAGTISARIANSGYVYLYDSQSGGKMLVELGAGDSFPLPVVESSVQGYDLREIWFDAATTGDKICAFLVR